jgi:hypothetical protein
MMAYEHEKSGTTICLDIVRHLLALGTAGGVVFFIWRWNWIVALLTAFPIYIVILNLVGFLTLRLYDLTPENRLGRKMMEALKGGDFEKGRALTREFEKRFNVNVPKDVRKE